MKHLLVKTIFTLFFVVLAIPVVALGLYRYEENSLVGFTARTKKSLFRHSLSRQKNFPKALHRYYKTVKMFRLDKRDTESAPPNSSW